MRTVVVALCLAVAVTAVIPSINPKTLEIINKVNNAKTTWTAGVNQFSTWTTERLKSIVGTQVMPHKPYTAQQLAKIKEFESQSNALPESFDARTQWKDCIHPIRDQARCGSCWAFGAAESLSDRFCIQSNGSVNVVLSPQDMVSCDSSNYGCEGGYLENAWAYLVNSGVVSEACFPYASQQGVAPMCPSTCVNSTKSFSDNKYKASNYYLVSPWLFFWERAYDIQKEVMTNGPLEVGFSVYSDFLQYKSGVYQYTTGDLLGGHAVKIIGWGVDATSKVPYWLIANSWSTTWGEQGYFRIKRGSNECGIEAQAYAGMADVSHVPTK